MSARIKDVLEFKGSAVHCVGHDASVAEAVRRMRAHRIGAVVVMDDQALCGIVSEGDVLQRVIAEHRDPDATPVMEIMSTALRTLEPETSLQDAMALVAETRCRHLPVVDADQVVGMVSAGDLTAWLVRELRLEIGDLVGYIQGPASQPPPMLHAH